MPSSKMNSSSPPTHGQSSSPATAFTQWSPGAVRVAHFPSNLPGNVNANANAKGKGKGKATSAFANSYDASAPDFSPTGTGFSNNAFDASTPTFSPIGTGSSAFANDSNVTGTGFSPLGNGTFTNAFDASSPNFSPMGTVSSAFTNASNTSGPESSPLGHGTFANAFDASTPDSSPLANRSSFMTTGYNVTAKSFVPLGNGPVSLDNAYDASVPGVQPFGDVNGSPDHLGAADNNDSKSHAAGLLDESVASLQPDEQPRKPFLNEQQYHTNPHFESRYLHVHDIPAGHMFDDNLKLVEAVMKQYVVFDWSIPLVPSISSGGIRLRFDNLSDANEAHQILNMLDVKAVYTSQADFAIHKYQDLDALDPYEGQAEIIICARGINDAQLTRDSLQPMTNAALAVAGRYGAIRDMVHVATRPGYMFVYRVEFLSVDACNRIVHNVDSHACHGVSMVQPLEWSVQSITSWQTTQPFGNRFDSRGRLLGFRTTKTYDVVDASRRHPADVHNRVRSDRIIDGSDVRTTVMLRNIPNKLDWLGLKGLLDRYCFGTYDFVYLRIDFSTANNVGYAFINFADVNGMLAMIAHIEKRTWDGFRSSKAAEISYATIQGKEALLQKFRNSSVMTEPGHCKPRLFWSTEDAIAVSAPQLAGKEHEFPPPDNPAKLQRSVDSARSQGLFPPNAGAGPSINERDPFSPFDHGNPRGLTHFNRIEGDQVPLALQMELEKSYHWAYPTMNGGAHVNYSNIPHSWIHSFLATNPGLLQKLAPRLRLESFAPHREQPGPIARPSMLPQGPTLMGQQINFTPTTSAWPLHSNGFHGGLVQHPFGQSNALPGRMAQPASGRHGASTSTQAVPSSATQTRYYDQLLMTRNTGLPVPRPFGSHGASTNAQAGPGSGVLHLDSKFYLSNAQNASLPLPVPGPFGNQGASMNAQVGPSSGARNLQYGRLPNVQNAGLFPPVPGSFGNDGASTNVKVEPLDSDHDFDLSDAEIKDFF